MTEFSNPIIVGNSNNNLPSGQIRLSQPYSPSGKIVLSAITTSISDADGLGPLYYQWLRNGEPIYGAHQKSYALTNSDTGKKISVEVTYIDGLGNKETINSYSYTTRTIYRDDIFIDYFYGNPDQDNFIYGNKYNNIIFGHDGNDSLYGDYGNDFLYGNGGDDYIVGGFGRDTILADFTNKEGNDTVYGEQGDDVINGGLGDDVLDGGEGDDVLDGGEGDDVLDGGAGDDTLTGGAGEDVLDGGAGDDTLTGGDGIDVFVFDRYISGTDIILDFLAGDNGDRLDFRYLLARYGYRGADPFGDGWLKLEQDKDDVLVKFEPLSGISYEGDEIAGGFPRPIARIKDVAIQDFTTFNAFPLGPINANDVNFTNIPIIEFEFLTQLAVENRKFSIPLSTINKTDIDGLSFQWFRDGVAIPGAINFGYRATADDIGHRISVRVIYIDDLGNIEVFKSVETAPITAEKKQIVELTQYSDNHSSYDYSSEHIFAMAGDDVIVSSNGFDIIDGGEGFDTVVYPSYQSSYTVQLSSSGVTVTDRRVFSSNQVDELVDVENLRFKDGDFNIDIRTGAADLPPEDFAAIVELYIAYFNRAPASKGLLYWADRLEDDMPLPKIAESFFVQPETQATYAAYLDEDGNLLDTEAFVTAVFNNVLGRDPYGPYWINELDNNPAITPAIFILAVLNGAKAPTGGAEDREYLANKIDIGIYFSAIKGLSDYDDTISVMNIFDGSEESVSAAVSEIDEIYAAAQDGDTGEFIMPLIGVVDNPFEIM